jgi:ubiquinone/menaquinone biosynthesis C-methylase UbiE
MRVLDVGCGPGAVSMMMAEAVGPKGSVVGIDIQPDQLARARRAAAGRGLNNVTFQVGDATDLPFGDRSFDLIYAKFLLMHLPDRDAGLDEMVRLLAPSGVLYLYEIDAGGSFFWPEGTPTQLAWDLAMSALTQGGSDIHMGRKLFDALVKRGLREVRAIPELTGACAGQKRMLEALKRQIVGVLDSLQTTLLSGGLATESELAALRQAVHDPYPNEFFTMCAIAAWGERGERS